MAATSPPRAGSVATTAAPESAGAITIDSLSFCRLECDHSDIFQLEYKRSNRTKGLKILRCFPHCCPNHIDRSYCGSSLHVIVQASGTASRAKLADNVFLFARFESSADDQLQVGDTLPSSDVTRAAQSEENPEGTWIPGVKERASVLSTAMQNVAQVINEQTLVYQLNGKVYSRWYYDWESGANKAQRLMRHVLKAYVFERVLAEDKHTPSTLRVVGVASSPEFTVISYRRAQSEGAGGNKADAATRDPSPSQGGTRRSSPDLDRPDAALLKRPYQERLSVSSMDSDSKRRRQGDARAPVLVRPPLALRDASPQQLFEDQVLWEHAHAPVVTVSKNLALVLLFLQWTPLDYYASFVDELVHLMNHQVLEPLGDKRPDKLNFFARVLLQQASSQPQRLTPAPAISRALEALLRTMAQVATWLFLPDTRRWVRGLVDGFAWTLPHKNHLRAAFVDTLVQLETRLNDEVFAHSPLQSLANAAEEIIAAVYTHDAYHPRRAAVRQVLGEHGFIGWRPFVAQMRDAFIEKSAMARPPRHARFASSPHPLEQAWNGEWVLDLDESAWKAADDTRAERFSLLSMLDVLTQLSRVVVTLRLDQRVLCVASRAALSSAARDGMKLVLDGKSRVCRFTPHGLSTAMTDGAEGDYIGAIGLDTPDRVVARIECFRWARRPDTRSYHVLLRVTHTFGKDQPRLWVNADVLETISTASFSSEELQYMPELKVAAKLKAVARGAARLPAAPQPDGTPRMNPGWRRLGGVRLTYCRARR